jgi:hypothetical protein
VSEIGFHVAGDRLALDGTDLQIVGATRPLLEVSAGLRTARTMDRFATPVVREWVRTQFGKDTRGQASLENLTNR